MLRHTGCVFVNKDSALTDIEQQRFQDLCLHAKWNWWSKLPKIYHWWNYLNATWLKQQAPSAPSPTMHHVYVITWHSPLCYPLLGSLGWLWWGRHKCEVGLHQWGRPEFLPPVNHFGTAEENGLSGWILSPMWKANTHRKDVVFKIWADTLLVMPRKCLWAETIKNKNSMYRKEWEGFLWSGYIFTA